MKTEDINVAIALILGWKITKTKGVWYWTVLDPEGKYVWSGENNLEGMKLIPNFANDLNEMHEAEKSLEPWQVVSYMSNLSKVTGNSKTIYHATSLQRAEAFLKTFNKWVAE